MNAPDEQLKLKMSNKIVINRCMPVKQSYKQILKDNYSASIDEEHFLENSELIQKLDGWVARETNNLIPKLFETPFNEYDISVLINVLYFRGLWSEKFLKEDTVDRLFNNMNGTKVLVKMMFQRDICFPYSHRIDEELKVISIHLNSTLN